MVGPLRGGGVKPGPLREKPLFFEHYKKVPMTTKPGGGGKGLSGPTTKKTTFFFCGFPRAFNPLSVVRPLQPNTKNMQQGLNQKKL